MNRILLIQTASIGDVILTTPVMEKLHHYFPDAAIDIVIKKGNEALFEGHPFLNEVIIWDKSKKKYRNLLAILKNIRQKKYKYIINFQRFASSGFLTCFSKAEHTVGFDKNPFSVFFSKKVKHFIYPQSQIHETERNLSLIEHLTPKRYFKPKLYPQYTDIEFVKQFKHNPYVCMAPASLWFTKQFPEDRWVDLIEKLKAIPVVYLLGAKNDVLLCERIRQWGNAEKTVNLAGKLSMLQSAALMQDAVMNYVNDSAPMHLASAVNAPVAAIFCSTVPQMGFGPLSETSFIIETSEKLSCRPCGIHGHKQCPEGHFACAYSIADQPLLNCINNGVH